MPNKTERILSYLPGTFRPSPQRSVLRAIVDAFGTELLNAENSLAAVMQSHWVGHADRGAKAVDDLACLASLYGLAPRTDESVEEFRKHLLHYIRTFIEGSVTVQGILRTSAEALGIRINDAYGNMDSWWRRNDDELITTTPDSNDASELIFGQKSIIVSGSPERQALVKGKINLSKGVDLRGASKLRLKIDDKNPIDVDLDDKGDLSLVTLERIEAAISNNKINVVASHDGPYLIIASATVGPESRLEVLDVEVDAAAQILGLAPRVYSGSDESPANVTGTPDLDGDIDLRDKRYLRLIIDKIHVAEIDCAGPNPAHTTLDQICGAINNALGIGNNVASNDGHHIRLTSPTKGFSDSSIVFQQPAAQDATDLLFGPVASFYSGRNPQSAKLTCTNDLSGGIDLSSDFNLQLNINGASRIINCAGEDPAHTNPDEIVRAINGAFNGTFSFKPAIYDGSLLSLTSPSTGSASQIILETPKERDATEIIFGISPRVFLGSAAKEARIVSAQDLSHGIDLRARHLLNLAVDGRDDVRIDLRDGALNYEAVTLKEISDNINKTLDPDSNFKIAKDDGRHLILESPTKDNNGSLAIKSLENIDYRRFVTRATVIDEAAREVFGFVEKNAIGKPSTSARVTGSIDLSGGVDLTTANYMRLAIDGQPAVDIYCAGSRPRASTIEDIVNAINNNKVPCKNLATQNMLIATEDNGHLILTSPTAGVSSQIAFYQPRPTDALDKLLGIEPGIFNGTDATGVVFVSTVDLSEGINLEDHVFIKIGVDGAPSVEIDLGGSKSIGDIIKKINSSFIGVASAYGNKIGLKSPYTGSKSSISFDVPRGKDATRIVFGIDPPRSYHGQDPAQARIIGICNLTGEMDLSTARFLRLTVDGTTIDVNCASKASESSKASLDDIIKSINEDSTLKALGEDIASSDGVHLILTSIKSGASSQIQIDYCTSEDARKILLGDVDDTNRGTDPKPAIITGSADILGPVDLSKRSLIRLAIDIGKPLDIDLAGASPKNTSLNEIEAAINKAFKSNIAGHTDDGHITITSPTTGEGSNISLLPLRYLEIIEYPPVKKTWPDKVPKTVVHGDSWQINNNGVADVYAEICLKSPQGTVGPSLVNISLGLQIRLLTVLEAGESVLLSRQQKNGLIAEIISIDKTTRPIPEEKILVEPIGNQSGMPSLAKTERLDKGTVLTLPRGISEWRYLDCLSARFNQVKFNFARFSGGRCCYGAIFDISTFSTKPPMPVSQVPATAVFASSDQLPNPPIEVSFSWDCNQPGAFIVNLPWDLPDRFGGRFNEARFGRGPADLKSNSFPKAVTEPKEDPDYLVKNINGSASLVVAEEVSRVPLGWSAVTIPFSEPQFLTLGSISSPACIFLTEGGYQKFIKLSAKEPGLWGNDIAVTAKTSGPARYNVEITYKGARFENARQVVLGLSPGDQKLKPCSKGNSKPPISLQATPVGNLPALVQDLLKPGAIGVLQAKAAGIYAEVSRDRCYQDKKY